MIWFPFSKDEIQTLNTSKCLLPSKMKEKKKNELLRNTEAAINTLHQDRGHHEERA